MCGCHGNISSPLHFVGRQDGVYDNTPGQRPGGRKGDGMEEDIYGGVGGEDEGLYDTAGGVKKGMKYSEEGLYDNPHAGKGELSIDVIRTISSLSNNIIC